MILWWAAALLVTAACIVWINRKSRPKARIITLAAFCTVAAFAIFQISIPIFGGVHLNLTPLIGILTGPAIGSLVVLIINILSAGIGHGGYGMIGANALVNVVEIVIAFSAYRAASRVFSTVFYSAGIATFASLLAGNIVMILIILVSGIQGVSQSTGQVLYGLSLIAAINMGVAAIEAVITGFIIAYIDRARPDILGSDRHA